MNGESTMETKKILYADDDAEIREALRLLLSCEGYETVEATNGEEVLQLLDVDKLLISTFFHEEWFKGKHIIYLPIH